MNCSWCGEKVPHPGSMQVRDLDIRFEKGWGGYAATMEGWEVEELCDKCVAKLRKLLEDNGIAIKEWDW